MRAKAIETLSEAGVPFLVAGAYAFFAYTGIFRDTKDLDLMLRARDVPAAFDALARVGFETDLLDPRWIGKAYAGESFVDLIFSSSNGLATVDDVWFEHASSASVLGHPCMLAPVEEIIFTKAFVDERERYDGADVNHLIYARGDVMQWDRLLERFGPHWEVLFAHLTLYRFVYPGARSRVPEWLVQELCRRTMEQAKDDDAPPRVCRGNLISARQYRHDYEALGLEAAPGAARPEAALRHDYEALGIEVAPGAARPEAALRSASAARLRPRPAPPPDLAELGGAPGVGLEEARLRKPAS